MRCRRVPRRIGLGAAELRHEAVLAGGADLLDGRIDEHTDARDEGRHRLGDFASRFGRYRARTRRREDDADRVDTERNARRRVTRVRTAAKLDARTHVLRDHRSAFERADQARFVIGSHERFTDQEAARAGGDSHLSVVLRFLLPNILPAMAVQVSLNLGWAILNAAGLSFIGLGVQAPTPEWGIMVAEGARFITAGKWWLVGFPGLALMLTVLCFNLLGDGMRDILDPRMRT